MSDKSFEASFLFDGIICRFTVIAIYLRKPMQRILTETMRLLRRLTTGCSLECRVPARAGRLHLMAQTRIDPPAVAGASCRSAEMVAIRIVRRGGLRGRHDRIVHQPVARA